MPKKITEGDRVQIVDREAVAADVKSGLFYEHYRRLTGTMTKLYPDRTATVNVELESLPKELRLRHEAGTEGQRRKWLDGLSDEARNRLSAAEKKFALRYTILVSEDDLVPATAARLEQAGETKPTTKTVSAPPQPILDMPIETEPNPGPARKSLQELEADEARYLDEKQKKNSA